MADFPRDLIKMYLTGKTLVLKYKHGGRIDEERIYNSTDDDPETIKVIGIFLAMYAHDEKTNKPDLSHNIIGNGVMGLLPWDDPGESLHRMQQAQKEGGTKESETMSYDWSGPIRVSDVREGADGTVFVDMEAS